MATPVNPNVPRELTKLLALGDLQLNRLETEQAVLTFCKAYGWDPCVTQTHLNTLSQQAFEGFLSALEDYCVWGFDTGRHCPIYDADLTLEQLCDWIITSNMKPKSLVAWSVKVNIQLQRKDYANVIHSCSQVLKTFSTKETSFLLIRAVAHLHLRHEKDTVNDYLTAFSANHRVTKDYILETQNTSITNILRVFYQVVHNTNDKKTSKDTNAYLTKCLQFILMLNPSDINSYLECAGIFVEQLMYKETVILLSDAMENATQDSDILRICLQRAESYLAMEEVELSLYDYLTALRIDEISTRSSILSLPPPNQRKIIDQANLFTDCIINDYRTQIKLCSSCSVHAQIANDQLSRAYGCYRVLYLIDSTNMDLLFNSADCLMLQGNDLKALDVYSQIVSLNPESAKAYSARGSCFVSLGDLTNALRDYDQALTIDPTNKHALCERMRALILVDQLDKGVSDMVKAAENGCLVVVNYIKELRFDEKETLSSRLRGYLTSSLQSEKVKCYIERLCLVGEVLTRICNNDLQSHLVYVELLLLVNKEDEAQSILVRLMNNNPSSYQIPVHLAVLKMRLGKTRIAIKELQRIFLTIGEEKLSEALKEISKVKLKTMISSYSYIEGVRSTESSERIALFTVAIIASSNTSWAGYYHRGKQYVVMGKMDLAVQDFTAALNINPMHVPSYLSRSVVLMLQKQCKQSMSDLVAALKIDRKTLIQVIQKLPVRTKQNVLDVLLNCVQGYFSVYSLRGIKCKCILPLSLLLVESDNSVSLYHSTLADAYFLFENYKDAVKELEISERLSSSVDTFVIGRQGLAHVKLNNFADATVCFSKISGIDPIGLEYMLESLNANQRQTIVQHALRRVDALLGDANHTDAVLYLNLAVIATQGHKTDILRHRCECLKSLKSFSLALDDVTSVINTGNPLITDYCTRASLRTQLDDLTGACADLMKAMGIDEKVAVDTVTKQHPEVDAVGIFCKVALRQCNEKRRFVAMETCNYGLKFDPSHEDLTKLKQKLESDVSHCILQ